MAGKKTANGGKVHWKRQRLYKHGGCEGCTKVCQYNACVARQDVAERTKHIRYGCNSEGAKR